jgi:peptide-methionine (S)-S-oxide reductase
MTPIALALSLLLAATPPAEKPAPRLETATLAGGCFWCLESDLDDLPGVVSTTSGFTGGHAKDPTYEEVSAGGTGHAEAVQAVFDANVLSYEKLLDAFWRSIDPTDAGGQFCDRGSQYRSAVFFHDETQQRVALASRQALEASKSLKESIVTEVVAASTFYAAEEYHQDYHRKNPIRYRLYRTGCGRDKRLKELWGKARTHDGD